MLKYKIVAITDEPHSCDFCGFNELSKSYICEDSNGNLFYFGSSCVTKATKIKESDIKKELKERTTAKENVKQICKQIANNEFVKSNEYKAMNYFYELGVCPLADEDEIPEDVPKKEEWENTYKLYLEKEKEIYKKYNLN